MIKTKTFILLVAILILSIFTRVQAAETLEETLVRDYSSSQFVDLGMDIKILLNQISSLDIDAKFFENPPFSLLIDFSVPVEPRPTGVRNPFLPLEQNIPWEFKNIR